MKTLIVAILTFLVTTSTAFATAQIPDKIFYDGKEYALHTNPMEPFFKEHPERRPWIGSRGTALRRGYIATFEIRNEELVLTEIVIREEGWTVRSCKGIVIPDGGDTLKVDWFSGLLVLPYGELVSYMHMGYGSTYSNYILLEIKAGKLTGKRTLDYKQYTEFREKQFQTFRKTEAYREQVERLTKEGMTQDYIDSFLRNFVIDYTSEFLDKEQEEDRANKTTDNDRK